jgi:lipopolysaccharide transport system ATP-binding protein
VSTAWIPGNLLSEGVVTVNVAITVYTPNLVIHVAEREVVGFRIVDGLDADSARGDYKGQMSGAVRPLLRWTTRAGSRPPRIQGVEVPSDVNRSP